MSAVGLNDTIQLHEVSILHRESMPEAASISTVVDSASMKHMQSRSLSELLSHRTSVYIKSTGRGALSTASFRGTDASHTKVYWNGIRINSPMVGQVDFSLIPVWLLDELSLLHGGSSLSEGSGAFGGAVLMENNADWKDGLSAGLNQEVGSFATFSTYGKLGVGNKKIRSETRIYRTSSANDYRYYNTDVIPHSYENLEDAAYRNTGIQQELYIRPADSHTLSLQLWYQDAIRNLPSVMSYEGTGRDESQADRDLRTTLEWNYYTPMAKLILRSGYMNSHLRYYLFQEDIDYARFDSKSQENSLFNTFQADVKGGEKSRLVFRVDYNLHQAEILDQTRGYGYRHHRNEVSLYGAYYRQMGEDWLTFILARQEWADGEWLPLMPSAGFRYRVMGRDDLSLKGSLSRNYNLPSLNDLYWIPGGNPDLKPEQGINSDVGLHYSLNKKKTILSASLTGFAARVTDWIIWRPTSFRYWEADNLSKVFSRGLEARVGMDISRSGVRSSLKANYALTRSTYESTQGSNNTSRGGQLVYIPVHTANIYLNISYSGYYLSTSISYTGKRHTQPSNESTSYLLVLNPYVLTDLYAGKEINIGRSRAGLQFVIYNLLNINYQTVLSRPMPLRNYALGLRWEL